MPWGSVAFMLLLWFVLSGIWFLFLGVDKHDIDGVMGINTNITLHGRADCMFRCRCCRLPLVTVASPSSSSSGGMDDPLFCLLPWQDNLQHVITTITVTQLNWLQINRTNNSERPLTKKLQLT